MPKNSTRGHNIYSCINSYNRLRGFSKRDYLVRFFFMGDHNSWRDFKYKNGNLLRIKFWLRIATVCLCDLCKRIARRNWNKAHNCLSGLHTDGFEKKITIENFVIYLFFRFSKLVSKLISFWRIYTRIQKWSFRKIRNVTLF